MRRREEVKEELVPLHLLNRQVIKVTEERKMEKLSHKLTLICVKYLPVIVAIFELLASVLFFLGVDVSILGYLLGVSVVGLIPMYIMSYAFKFCKYHRMILNYIVSNKLLYLIDYIFIIPFGNIGIVGVSFILAGIFLALTIYNYLKYGDRNNT